MVREKIAVKLSCLVLNLSRSGYYEWRDRPVANRQLNNEILISEIKIIHNESRGTYGLPRIKAVLKNMGKSCGKTRIENLMKKASISGLIIKKFKINTTNSNHKLPTAERIFKTEEPHTHPVKQNQVWASDITYVPTQQGFVFLGTYLDLFTKKIVGFETQDHMRTELLLGALDMALGRQHFLTGELVSHSDRGSQYASEIYREKLKTLDITASMSRRGNCYDNAFAESFFATLKKELVYRTKFKTKDEAKKAIFEFIEVWYNRKRLHSSIGFMTPVQFEESLVA
jgi:putative transposase